MINRLRSYRNGVHGQFFLDVADELERLQMENTALSISNAKLREYFREANLRTIINTKSVQIFGEIEQTVSRVRNLEQLPVSAINYIDALLDVIKEEAAKNG